MTDIMHELIIMSVAQLPSVDPAAYQAGGWALTRIVTFQSRVSDGLGLWARRAG